MKNYLPSVNPNLFTISAFTIGYLLIDDLTPAEQNAIGNWFMLIGQVLCTNSAQQQVLNNRSEEKENGDHVVHSDNSFTTLRNTVQKMEQELHKYPS